MWFNKLIVSVVKLLPKKVVYFFAKKYIAGVRLQDAINTVKELNSKNILATMDVLGESINTKDEVLLAKTECIAVLSAIEENNLNANLSIKPTQLGLLIDDDFCFEQVRELVEKAKSINNFVRLDMEDSGCTQKTIDLYKRLRKDFDNVGIVVQSYLKRTFDDVCNLNENNAHYRLCKGIYIEPEEIAFKDKQEVRDNFVKVLKRMFEDKCYVGIATHDDYLVDEAYKLIKEMRIPNDKFEFQMLLGVKEDLREKINKDGYKVRVYVPFGQDWYAYSIRRLQENPNMAFQIAKNIFSLG
ncbi:MAG: proline dehydrogenase family protein [Ignavibacteriaceae bacterium]|nr:proline dehydrogenase family protein [Ignavibacteriaceae bacterium]